MCGSTARLNTLWPGVFKNYLLFFLKLGFLLLLFFFFVSIPTECKRHWLKTCNAIKSVNCRGFSLCLGRRLKLTSVLKRFHGHDYSVFFLFLHLTHSAHLSKSIFSFRKAKPTRMAQINHSIEMEQSKSIKIVDNRVFCLFSNVCARIEHQIERRLSAVVVDSFINLKW